MLLSNAIIHRLEKKVNRRNEETEMTEKGGFGSVKRQQ